MTGAGGRNDGSDDGHGGLDGWNGEWGVVGMTGRIRTIREGLDGVRVSLREGGVGEWEIEAEVLLRHVLGLERSDFLAVAYGGGSRPGRRQAGKLGEGQAGRVGQVDRLGREQAAGLGQVDELGREQAGRLSRQQAGRLGEVDRLGREQTGELGEGQVDRLRELVGRRLEGEPLAYIVGRREFYGLDLEVDESVLVPRQETELLVETALERLAGMKSTRDAAARVVDVGTGCGAIALAIAKHSERADVVGVDVSAAALEVAMKNAARLGLGERVRFVRGNLLEAVEGPVDIAVSNPPYIPSGEIGSLATEVRREPRLALDGGADGLDVFRRLVGQARGKMASDGVMVVELMPEQMDSAARFAEGAIEGARASCRFDLVGNRRALVVEMGG